MAVALNTKKLRIQNNRSSCR